MDLLTGPQFFWREEARAQFGHKKFPIRRETEIFYPKWNYSAEIAPMGHSLSQAPQSMQAPASIIM